MSSPRRRARILRSLWRRPARAAALALAAWPVFQATGCYPDPVGAFNFQLQLLVNTTLISAIDTIVRNLFGL
jgi:hypothetical protein